MKQILEVLIVSILLAACAPAPTIAPTVTASATATPFASATPTATATSTLVPPTPTLVPPTATTTPQPSATPKPSPSLSIEQQADYWANRVTIDAGFTPEQSAQIQEAIRTIVKNKLWEITPDEIMKKFYSNKPSFKDNWNTRFVNYCSLAKI